MDLSGLIAIRDGVSKNGAGRNVKVRNYEVVKRDGTILDDAIGKNKSIGSRLRINDKNKISRIQSISRQQPSTKTKYIVLDSRAINEIAEMSNSQRRNFLAHLSDSDRRRVLKAIRVKDNLEDGQLKRRDLNRTLEPQDLYVINDLLTKFAYSRKDDELRMLESYKDLLDENDGQELALLTLINKVIDGDLNLDEDADIVNDVYNFFEDNDFETDSLDASLNAAFGDTNSSDVEVEDDELSEDLGDEDLLEDEGLEDEGDLDLDIEGGEEEAPQIDLNDTEGEDEDNSEDDLQIDLGDSKKNAPILDKKKIVDSTNKSNKPFQAIEASIIDDSYDLAMKVLKSETVNIVDSTNKIVDKYSQITGETVRVKDCFDRAFACSLSRISNYLYDNVQKVKDDIIDQIDEKLGVDSEEAEGKTLLESLGSALEAFANGDNTELQALAELTIDDVNPDEEFNEDEEENEEEENEDEDLLNEGEDEDNAIDLDLNIGDSVKSNVVGLAKALINNDKKANSYIDKLKDSVEILQKVNFKIADSLEDEDEVYNEPVDVIEPYLTQEEFKATYNWPLYVGEMAKEANPASCVSAPTSVNYGTVNPVIQVECNGIYQNWMPITGSNENIIEQLSQEGVDVAKTISDNCVPVEDYYTAAAKTNNLGIIDSKFYKRKLSDEAWICDGIADCIADEGVEPGATFMQSGLTTMPKVIPSGSVLIYGTKYDYYNKSKK